MEIELVRQVWERASDRCEYCQLPQEFDDAPFELDHIIARKHNGLTVSGNLALSCFHDNSHKGPNIAGRDLKTGKLVPLFNPQRHKWTSHFRWQEGYLIGRTVIGRVTIAVLNINDPVRVELREELLEEGQLPPRMS
jgi:HNH endonuclease